MDAKQVSQFLQEAYFDTKPYQTLNFNRLGYFEADVFMVGRGSMLVTEIEVKVSLSDFKADFKKTSKHYRLKNRTTHDHCRIPSYFYYACPNGLISIDLIPEYAGLIYVNENGSTIEIKKAPKLHDNKVEFKVLMGMLENLTANRIYGCQKMTHERKISKKIKDEYEAEQKRIHDEFMAHTKKLRQQRKQREQKGMF